MDADNRVEILTVGSATTLMGVTQAQLRIWEWSGTVLTLEKDREFTLGDDTTSFPTEYGLGVFAGVLDGDPDVEIVTVGYAVDTTGAKHDHLAIWTWDDTTLTRKVDLGRVSPATMRGVYGYDFDGTYMEIVTVGEDGSNGDVIVFNWDGAGSSITLVDKLTWSDTVDTNNDVQGRSVHIGHIEGSAGVRQIVVGGYVGSGTTRNANVRVYDFSNRLLSLAGHKEWQQTSSVATEAFSVNVGKFDTSVDEVAACGSFDNGGNPKAEVQFLKWSSGALITDGLAYTWLVTGDTSTQCRGVFAADMTSRTGLEIVAGGYALISGTEKGEARSFNYDSSTNSVSNVEYTRWTTMGDTRVNGVYCADVDADSVVEYLTAGQAKDAGGTLNGQLRIWHLSVP